MGKKRKNYGIVIGKFLGKVQIGRLRRRWDNRPVMRCEEGRLWGEKVGSVASGSYAVTDFDISDIDFSCYEITV